MNAHLMCETDWRRLPDPKPLPVAVPHDIPAERQPCCWCGEATNTGIFFAQHEPSYLHCNGEGEIHKEEVSQPGPTPSVTDAGESESQEDGPTG